jgi:hypothetical protein
MATQQWVSAPNRQEKSSGCIYLAYRCGHHVEASLDTKNNLAAILWDELIDQKLLNPCTTPVVTTHAGPHADCSITSRDMLTTPPCDFLNNWVDDLLSVLSETDNHLSSEATAHPEVEHFLIELVLQVSRVQLTESMPDWIEWGIGLDDLYYESDDESDDDMDEKLEIYSEYDRSWFSRHPLQQELRKAPSRLAFHPIKVTRVLPYKYMRSKVHEDHNDDPKKGFCWDGMDHEKGSYW